MIIDDTLSLCQLYMYTTIFIITTIQIISFVFYNIEFVCFCTSFLDFVFMVLFLITPTFKTNFFPEPYRSILDCVLIVIVSPVLYKIALYQKFFVRKISSSAALPLYGSIGVNNRFFWNFFLTK